ncbi:MAG: acylphosphatase [Tindallia sp. MSAO_Bac2]|nr:MAG: acylphosphatase [Tindallia sp. MSAO_Bac2]
MKALLIYVTGKVQGVAFRHSAREKALSLSLTGWVRNRKDGSVEIFVQGDQDQVCMMEKWAQQGPPAAEVENITVYLKDVQKDINGFIVRPTC